MSCERGSQSGGDKEPPQYIGRQGSISFLRCPPERPCLKIHGYSQYRDHRAR